jgi:hypothetical protein
MFEFLVNRICPLILIVVAIAAIDTPGNFIRTWVLVLIHQNDIQQVVKHIRF